MQKVAGSVVLLIEAESCDALISRVSSASAYILSTASHAVDAL
jgi:hypothetical protein